MSSRKTGDVMALVGAQFGSEGKGVIVNKIADRYGVHVRTGGTNAGHTFKHKGQKVVMQTIPCGWTNPNAFVVIGAGGLVEIGLLMKEIELVKSIDPTILDRLIIDTECGVISEENMREEGGVHGEMHQRMGSTGKGVGAARRDRMMRDPKNFSRMGDLLRSGTTSPTGLMGSDSLPFDFPRHIIQPNTAEFIEQQRRMGTSILLEGTQGAGLSLIHGYYPYVTSADTNAAQMCADAGIAPRNVTQTMLVARTFPIRVAGNSGTMFEEMTWEDISARVGYDVVERTTVTKKVRRIGNWDEPLMSKAVLLNNPTSIAITFMDYLSPEDTNKSEYGELSQRSRGFVEYVETKWGAPVALLGTGGDDWTIIDRGLAL